MNLKRFYQIYPNPDDFIDEIHLNLNIINAFQQ